jgi:hypothetical protein
LHRSTSKELACDFVFSIMRIGPRKYGVLLGQKYGCIVRVVFLVVLNVDVLGVVFDSVRRKLRGLLVESYE